MAAVPIARALRKLGRDLKEARLRRRIPIEILSQRASIGRATLRNIEKGAESVSMGKYATVLFVLGMIDRLEDLADPREDSVGLGLEEERLPQRIRQSRKKGGS